LQTGLADAISGRGRLGGVFLISGEPGIGKTRLADELARDAASRGIRVVWGRCWEGGGAPAYLPWADVVRTLVLNESRERERRSALPAEIAQLIPELSPETVPPRAPSDPSEARFRLFDAVAMLLKHVARSEPLLVILDDLHEADQSSLELLKFVARGLTDARMVIVGTYRDAEVRHSAYLSEKIGEILRFGHAIPLAGLDRDEVTRIVENRARRSPSAAFASELHRVTAGNPLFVDGVIRVMLAERSLGTSDRIDLRGFKLPEDVRGAIRKRLGLISTQAQPVLAMAAVIGQEFDPSLLQRVSNVNAATIGELMKDASDTGLVARSSPDSYRFTHALIRESLYAGLADTERIGLHRAIGEALEQMHVADLTPHLAALAHQYREAGVVYKAVDYSIRAGEAAQALYAYDEAISQFKAALSLGQHHDTDLKQRADLLSGLGNLLQLTDTQLGIEQLESAAEIYAELNLPDDAARVHQKLSQILVAPGERKDTDQALMHMREAERLSRENPASKDLGGFYYSLGVVAEDKGLLRESLAAYGRSMEELERLDTIDGWCAATVRYAAQLVLTGRIKEGLRFADLTWEKIPEIKDSACFLGTIWGGGGNYQILWDFRPAQQWFRKGLGSPLPSKYQRDVMRFQIGTNHFNLGEIAAMREQLSDWQNFDGPIRLRTEEILAQADADWDRARRVLEAQFESKEFKAGSLAPKYKTQRALASIVRESGDYAKAEELLRTTLASCPSDEPALHLEMLVRPELALVLASVGRLKSAYGELNRCAEIISIGENWRGLAGHYYAAAGFCAGAAGNDEAREHHFEEAIGIFRRFALPWFQADTLRSWGQALTKGGQPSSAREKFDAAIDIYRRIGAGQAWTDRTLEEKARATGVASIEQPSNSKSECVFRKEGEYWTTAYEGEEARLRERGGMRFIAMLLGQPGENISAIELFAAVAAVAGVSPAQDGLRTTSDLGDAGGELDARALGDYRRRITELESEIDRAEASHDSGALDRARAERERLSEEIASGTGLHGGLRRAASHRERARVNVTRQIKSAIYAIRRVNPPLGRHLANAIYTGRSCRYAPAERVKWQL